MELNSKMEYSKSPIIRKIENDSLPDNRKGQVVEFFIKLGTQDGFSF